MGDLTPHFSRKEFRCSHGLPCESSAERWHNILMLAQNLEVLRESLGVPIHILSGYRCPTCNRQCGGVPRSQHLYGRAADIWCESIDPDHIALHIYELIRAGKMMEGGVGIYHKGRVTQARPFLHYDIRGVRARWRQRRR